MLLAWTSKNAGVQYVWYTYVLRKQRPATSSSRKDVSVPPTFPRVPAPYTAHHHPLPCPRPLNLLKHSLDSYESPIRPWETWKDELIKDFLYPLPEIIKIQFLTRFGPGRVPFRLGAALIRVVYECRQAHPILGPPQEIHKCMHSLPCRHSLNVFLLVLL